ncbi:MAG: glycosyltransferase [Muribaculaceae bacterium]|nr:glycosyltransferase [Muribaculaceae bacterium]
MKTVVLITSSYPYGVVTERTFVEPEIAALAERFERVIVLPLVRKEDKFDTSTLPSNVSISDFWIDYEKHCGKRRRLRHLLSPRFWQLAKGQRRDGATLKYVSSAMEFASALPSFLTQQGLALQDTLFYTFWFELATSGLALVHGAKYVSRCHNYDLYGPRAHHLRGFSIAGSRGIYDVSLAGAAFLNRQFPGQSDKIKTVTLGSIKAFPQSLNPAADGGDIIKVFSCSRVEPVKRVALNLEMMRRLAAARPGKQIVWEHAGSGSLFAELQAAASTLPPNLSVRLHGEMTNREVQELYTKQHFDFLLLLSTREGLPIAICEAMSYGVPVIATAAGGTGEIVDADVGALLPVDFADADFAEAVRHVMRGSDEMRRRAWEKWEKCFNGKTLRQGFAQTLHEILEQ